MSTLGGILAPWSAYYGNHQIASVSIRFLHLVALIFAGGTGLFADRQVLRAAKAEDDERDAVMVILGRCHKHVVSWIVVLGATGVLMAAADTATYMVSKVFWIKMSLIGLLVANGAFLLAVERRTRRLGVAVGWPRLMMVSTISAILWLTTLFMGTLLTVAA